MRNEKPSLTGVVECFGCITVPSHPQIILVHVSVRKDIFIVGESITIYFTVFVSWFSVVNCFLKECFHIICLVPMLTCLGGTE